MFHVHDGYRKTFRIPARSFNFLAKFCNNLSPGFGITMRRPEKPSATNPVTVAVNTEDLAEVGFATLQANATAEGQTVAELVSSATPADVAEYDEDETDEEKQARIGTSNCAARADHQHMMPKTVDNETRKDMVGTNKSGGKISGKDLDGNEYDRPHTDTTTWTRGTDTETVDGESVDAGLKIMLPCRFISDGIDGYVRFRQFEFDQAGRLVKVGAEAESTPYTATT